MKTIAMNFGCCTIVISIIFLSFTSCERNDSPYNPVDSDTLTTKDFAPIGAKWYFSQGFAWSENKEYLIVESVGDTIIKGKSCRMLEKKGSLYCTYYNKKDFVYRENGIVYFYTPEIDKFQILYNFKAQKDSSWINVFDSEFGLDTVLVKVDSVTKININNLILRKLYVTYKSLKKSKDWRYYGTIIEKMSET